MMSTELLSVLILLTLAAVVAALFVVMWRERSSADDARTAVIAGTGLAAWAIVVTVLALRGAFVQADAGTFPPIGIALMVALGVMTASLWGSSSLRRLLTNQQNLIRLNIWRLVGAVFLLLMIGGQVPALWALPAGIGDVIVGATAFWVANRLETPGGRNLAILFNLFGLADLVVAIGLGFMTSPGPGHVFNTVPTGAMLAQFPLVLVPGFLVPLAVKLHLVSLRQLFAGTWATGRELTPARS